MKFSVLTIFFATGYVALVLAAIQPPDSWWRHVAVVAWLAVVAYLFVLAADPLKRPRATFGRVTLGCIAAYLALAYLPSTPGDLLPHQWFAAWWAPEENSVYSVTTLLQTYQGSGPINQPYGSAFSGSGFPGGGQLVISPTIPSYPSHEISSVAALNSALLFGLLGGLLAAWRYRRIDRTETTSAPVAIKHPIERAAAES